jgi:peptidyl-prolyl cis-trans isomerase SurA
MRGFRSAFLTLLLAAVAVIPARAVLIDRIAALVERQVITVSEIDQMIRLRFFPRQSAASDDDYRRDVLEALIAQSLRYRDVERFGAEDIPKDSIEARLQQLRDRFPSDAELQQALADSELTLDELRAIIKRQLQVEAYIQERFSPTIFVPLEDIETYYRTTWTTQRRDRGLPIPPLAEVREEIRTILKSNQLQREIDKWTGQLRARANVDVYTYR